MGFLRLGSCAPRSSAVSATGGWSKVRMLMFFIRANHVPGACEGRQGGCFGGREAASRLATPKQRHSCQMEFVSTFLPPPRFPDMPFRTRNEEDVQARWAALGCTSICSKQDTKPGCVAALVFVYSVFAQQGCCSVAETCARASTGKNLFPSRR